MIMVSVSRHITMVMLVVLRLGSGYLDLIHEICSKKTYHKLKGEIDMRQAIEMLHHVRVENIHVLT